MLGTELIDKYRDKLSSPDCTDDDKHSALLFALQIPSVCSRIEYPADEYAKFYRKMVDLLIISFTNIGLEIIKANLKHYGV